MAHAWFEESYYPHWRQRIRIEQLVHRERTAYQDLIVFDSVDFGRVLALDGVIQTTELDEFVYHEMISHVPLVAHGSAREVLIVGGGDGGTLEEVLKHECVERATMVELDARVVEVAKAWLPSLSRGAFDDPRTELVFADGIDYVAKSDRAFDVIIIDSTDPVGPGEVLFDERFYANCKAHLRGGGVLVTQSGNTFGEERSLWNNQHRLRGSFASVDFYLAAPPTYVGGPFAFGFASDDPAKCRLDRDALAARFVPAGLRYYSPAMHAGAFAHPPWLDDIVALAEPPPERA